MGAVDGDALRILAGVKTAGQRVRGFVEIYVARGVAVGRERQVSTRIDAELHNQVARRRNDIGAAGTALRRKPHSPWVGEELPPFPDKDFAHLALH